MPDPKVVDVIDVKRHPGKAIIVPAGIPLMRVAEVIQRQARYEEERTDIFETIPVFPYDGAIALHRAMEEQFGVAFQEGTFFSDATTVKVEVGVDETRNVPWGVFSLPNLEDGHVCTGTATVDGRIGIKIHVKVKRKYEAEINTLLARTRELAQKESIYRGKAISIVFNTDEDGPSGGEYDEGLAMPVIKFLRLAPATPIFRRELEEDIERDILTPIRHTKKFREDGTSLKLGVLLAGPYGTGKTLLANQIANEAIANGWTFIYVPKTSELKEALEFARGYQPCIPFVEDAERVAGLERTDEVNDLLNVLDGVDGKALEMITVLTSNHPDRLNAAMRRPGRIDVWLNVLPPDGEAVERLIRLYAGRKLARRQELAEVGVLLNGEIPAVVREVVEQSTREAYRRTNGTNGAILAVDLLKTARRYQANREAFMPATPEDARTKDLQTFGRAFGEPIASAITALAVHGGNGLDKTPVHAS